MTIYQRLCEYRNKGEKGLFILLDPDKQNAKELCKRAVKAEELAVSAILVGGSQINTDDFDATVKEIKSAVQIPVLLFPGSSSQLSKYADAVLFLSLISGRNPQYLISEQVSAAPRVKQLKIEVIPTAYMLIESGSITALEFISGTKPIPRDQIGIATAHALAGEYLGMKLVYLEAGSGALKPVPREMISAVKKTISLPLIVGGGIRNPNAVKVAVDAGADFLVVGNALEGKGGEDLLSDMVSALKYQA
jgi:putative glycerol-1-phosphate prenyltransferase